MKIKDKKILLARPVKIVTMLFKNTITIILLQLLGTRCKDCTQFLIHQFLNACIIVLCITFLNKANKQKVPSIYR